MAQPRLVPDVEPQQAFDEVTIEDEDLRLALETRNEKRAEAAEARAAYKFASDRANAEISKLELPVGGAVRCGRFRITRRKVDGRSVSFETAASDRVTIALVD
jgi:hypothetical protein